MLIPGIMNVERTVPPAESGQTSSTPRRWGPTATYLLLIAVVIGAIAVWGSISRQRAELAAVASMSDEGRGQLYGRVLENLRFCKAQSSEGLERFCEAQAEFVLGFPECDQGCKELARRSLSHAAR